MTILNTMADWEVRQAERAKAAKALQAAHPYLVPVSEKTNALVAAAKNIRIELARAFPGVAFSVKSKRFSMGDDIRVRWIDGPTTSQVDSIIGKYAAGHFDGMTDSYDYNDERGWTDAFGDAKYVFSERELSDRTVESVLRRVAHQWGVDPVPSVADYRSGKLWNVRTSGGCDDFGREVNVAASKHTCAIGAA